MSTAEFGDPNLGQSPAPAPAPDALTSPLTLSATPQPAPVVQPATPQAPVVPVQDMRDVPLGTLIFREGLLTEEQLEEALHDGMQRGKRLGEVLLERGLVSERDLGRLLAGQKGLRFVELDEAVVDPAAVQLLPVEKARLHSVLPIGFQDGLPVVAVADPSNDLVVENVRRAMNCEPHLVVAAREPLHRQIELAYATIPNGAAPAPVAAEAPPTAPAVPVAPAEPVAPVVVEPQPVVPAAPALPPQSAPASGEGVWLGAPEPVVQPEPVAYQAPETPPMPAPEPQVIQPVVETPVVQQPVPEPVSISFTPVEPVAQPPVEAPPPAPAPEPVVVAEPVLAPEPVTPPEPVVAAPPLVVPPAPEPEEESVLTWAVYLRLSDGERIEIGAFHSSGEAKEHAESVVRQLSTSHTWPFFGGRFLKPDAIVSVDLSEPEGRWLGSTMRRQAWQNPNA